MNFLVDAHLPLRLALAIRAEGYDVKHTLDLPDANKTTDRQINELCNYFADAVGESK